MTPTWNKCSSDNDLWCNRPGAPGPRFFQVSSFLLLSLAGWPAPRDLFRNNGAVPLVLRAMILPCVLWAPGPRFFQVSSFLPPPPLVEGRGHRIVDGPDHQRNTACYLGKIGKVCRFVHILPSAASCGERATFRRKPRRKDLLTRNFWLPPPHVRSPPWRAPHARVPAFRAWLN
jgi:hypothetical protein